MKITLYDGPCAELTHRIIGCAIEVHRHLGPGLLENVYQAALCVELSANRIPFQRQVPIPLLYRDEIISEHRIDLIVEDAVIVEVKSVERLVPIHRAQLLTYLRVKSLKVGLLLNFNSVVMKDGIVRIVL